MNTQSRTPVSPVCLHVHQEAESDLNMGQLAAPHFAESRKLKGPLPFLSGGSRTSVCVQPKNSLCLSSVHPISLNNGCAEQVMR